MRRLRAALLFAIGGVGCGLLASSTRAQRGHPGGRAGGPADATPRLALREVAPASLCITKGELVGARVEAPTFRAVLPGHSGDAASIRFVVRGPTATSRALASGSNRRQLGLKLRARDGCNLLYVMWRLYPKPKLDVSIKLNPGARTHRDCGVHGYTTIEPTRIGVLPDLAPGTQHELRAEIRDDGIVAWIDGRVMWRGPMPAEAHDLSGPAGVRSDNLAYELAAVLVDARSGGEVDAKCRGIDRSDIDDPE